MRGTSSHGAGSEGLDVKKVLGLTAIVLAANLGWAVFPQPAAADEGTCIVLNGIPPRPDIVICLPI